MGMIVLAAGCLHFARWMILGVAAEAGAEHDTGRRTGRCVAARLAVALCRIAVWRSRPQRAVVVVRVRTPGKPYNSSGVRRTCNRRHVMSFKRWLYRGGRPNGLARVLNRGFAVLHALGVFPDYMVTLRVVGRRSGRPVSFPLAMARLGGERYLVSMLGEDVNWVRNVRAAGGRAVLRHGRTESVRLVEVDADERAPILKEYLRIAPGARPHVAVGKDDPVVQFEKVAARYPVFRIATHE